MTSRLRLTFAAALGRFEEQWTEMHRPVAEAITAAMRDVAGIVKSEGAANIRAGGFGPRWQKALAAKPYPAKGVSLDPAVWVYHAIPYAEVFEAGAVIRGKPLLWLPVGGAPKSINGKKFTPKNFRRHVGDLRELRRPGKRPLLMADLTSRKGGKSFAVQSIARIARWRAQGREVRSVPVFVGIDVVNIRKRFAVRTICASARDRLPELYAKHFKEN